MIVERLIKYIENHPQYTEICFFTDDLVIDGIPYPEAYDLSPSEAIHYLKHESPFVFHDENDFSFWKRDDGNKLIFDIFYNN